MKQLKFYELIRERDVNNIKDIFKLEITSKSTIRRWLKRLEAIGYVKMYYGGAIEFLNDEQLSLDDKFKEELNESSKIKIGRQCAKLIDNDDVIFLDNGTTVRHILQFLGSKKVTIYTNGYHHLEIAEEQNLQINLIPGQVLFKEAALVGEESLVFLSNMNFDKVFIGANGFDEKKGVTTPNFSEAKLKQLVLEQGRESYLVMDISKYQKVLKYKICNFDDYKIIPIKVDNV